MQMPKETDLHQTGSSRADQHNFQYTLPHYHTDHKAYANAIRGNKPVKNTKTNANSCDCPYSKGLSLPLSQSQVRKRERNTEKSLEPAEINFQLLNIRSNDKRRTDCCCTFQVGPRKRFRKTNGKRADHRLYC